MAWARGIGFNNAKGYVTTRNPDSRLDKDAMSERGRGEVSSMNVTSRSSLTAEGRANDRRSCHGSCRKHLRSAEKNRLLKSSNTIINTDRSRDVARCIERG